MQSQGDFFLLDFLQALGVSQLNLLDAICDENYEKSLQLVQENPNITKAEFLEQMGIEEDY